MRKNNKRALILSSLCLLLCVSMLVGSTFAWFTDVAKTTANTIQSGTLNIDIQDASGNSLDGKALDFLDNAGNVLKADDILWEPGCTFKLTEAKLVNLGNLALKFKVEISGITGDTELADVIEIKIGGETKGTLAELMADPDGAAYGYLLPNGETMGAYSDTASVGQIELHMMESAGNQYQGKKLEGLSIFVSATQYTYESDSIDNTYDENAEYAEINADVYVSTDEDLVTQLKNAEFGDVIALKSGNYTLTADVVTKGTLIVEANDGASLNLAGHSIQSAVSKEENAPTVRNYGNLDIVGGTITNNNGTAGKINVAAIHNISGNLTVTNCTIKNVAPTSGGDYAVVVDGGSVTLDNCAVTGNRGGIAVSNDGTVTMNGGSVSATVYYPLYVRGTGASTFNGVTFTKESSNKGKALTYNAMEGSGSVTFTTCEFVSKLSSETKLDINNDLAGFNFTGCTFTNVKNPIA